MADDGYDTEYGDSWDDDPFVRIAEDQSSAMEGEPTVRIYRLMIEYQMLHVSPNDVPPRRAA